MSDRQRRLFIASRWLALVLAGTLLLELFRSFLQTDTVAVAGLTCVTDRGSLYLLMSGDLLRLDSEEVMPGSIPWPVRLVPNAWSNGQFFGMNLWLDNGGFLLVKVPIILPLLLSAMYLLWWQRRAEDALVRRTFYLACPSCGYLLCEVHLVTCPECGAPALSRVVQALPPEAATHPRTRRHASTPRRRHALTAPADGAPSPAKPVGR